MMCGMGWAKTCGVLAALMLAAGTGMQAVLGVQALGERREELRAAVAIRELHEEFSWWRQPVRRWKQEQTIRELKRESQAEAVAYRRSAMTLSAWSALCTGAMFAVIAAVSA